MQLQPRRQPGRADRKAAAYAQEIARLRRAGYTYEAIREALAEVGIQLSTSALRREVRRLLTQTTHVPLGPPPAAPLAATPAPPSSSVPSPGTVPAVVSSSREHAEAFFKAHPGNPLLRTREIP